MAGPYAQYEGKTIRQKSTGKTYRVVGGQMQEVGEGTPAAAVTPNAEALSAIQEARKSAGAASSAIPNLERFKALNKQTATGPGYGDLKLPFIGNINPMPALAKMGMLDGFDKGQGQRLQQMEGITADMIPSKHITPGPMTDADAAMYERSLPTIKKGGDANMAAVELMRAAQQNAVDYASFIEDYARRNNGRTVGAVEEWQKYSTANPLYAGEAPNPNRMPWRNYFSQQQAPQAGPAAPQQAPKRIRVDAQGNVIQ